MPAVSDMITPSVAATGVGPLSPTVPCALVSASALADGIARATSHGGTVADVRADAWGHGLHEVAACLVDAGVRRARVTSVDDARLVADLGLVAATDTVVDIDPSVMYGLPVGGTAPLTRPVMTLRGTVMSTKPIRAGGGVSYGYIHRAPADSRLALVTGGYAHGVPRAVGSRADVQIGDRRVPVVGRVAMDVCVVDIGRDGHADVGEPVTFFGGTGPMRDGLARWSRITGLTAAELVITVGSHTRREWVR